MRILRFMWKWWLGLWVTDQDLSNVIDSHRWENKIEIYRSLKSRCS
ncbi:MAG: hypothetical protein ACYS1A_02630 [Planctomycetota bacterium]